MQKTVSRALTSMGLTTGLCIGAWGALPASGDSPRRLPPPPSEGGEPLRGTAFDLPRLQVRKGTEAAAKEYYRHAVSPQIGLLQPDTILDSTIADLMKYFGYPNLEARDLHLLNSDELMARAPDNLILASRFFAPKVTDVSDEPTLIPEGGFGWRKLVRLKARDGSTAGSKGLDSMFLLQNIFEDDLTVDPFRPVNVSKVNQVIVVRRAGPFSDERRAAYFMLYSQLVKVDNNQNNKPVLDSNREYQSAGRLALSLAATFDENDRNPETNLPPNAYFTPDSCLQCHGNNRRRGKLNYLDTDHWFDRVHPRYGVEDDNEVYRREDFTVLGATEFPYGILRDGGKDVTSERFQRAFSVIRKLNEEIKTQNEGAPGNTFQLDAVKKWLELHKTEIAHIPPYQRGFGAAPWDANRQTHRKILYFLNRYCYRCHSSVRYNVFDRAEVKRLTGVIPGRLLEIEESGRWMPQDRMIPGLIVENFEPKATEDLRMFIDLLGGLAAEAE